MVLQRQLKAWWAPALALLFATAGTAWIGIRPGAGRDGMQTAMSALPRVEPRARRRPKVNQDHLPSAKTWRELRRDPRFDHSPGSAWRTHLLPDEDSQQPRRIQSNLVKSKSLHRILHILDAGDFDKWNAVNLATAWHRLAKFSRDSTREPEETELRVRDLQRRLTQAVLDLGPEEFDTRGISSLFYAWGIMRFKSKLIKPFCISARKRLWDFDPQSIANMIFGIGLLGLKGEDRILDAVGKHVPQRLQEFRPEEVTSMVYALGKLGFVPSGDMLESIGDFVIDRLDDFTPVQLTKIVEASCDLEFKKNRLMFVLWNDIARRIKLFSTHQILVLVRSAAKTNLKHAKFTKAATAEVMGRLKDLGRDVRLVQIMDNLKVLQKLTGKHAKASKSAD
mmetsp:Transcript_33606/g.77553  ORF Transcript_33606/g.77553 Transcript_33606/m.77553 type:complete len:394 (-) Transcript_33606:219-1400(-)